MIIKVSQERALEQARRQTSLPRADFALAAHQAGDITEAEAEEWAAGTALPTWVSDAIDAAIASGDMPGSEKLPMRIAARTNASIPRVAPLIGLLAKAKGLTDADVDALFGIGA